MMHDREQRQIWLQKIKEKTFTEDDMKDIIQSFSKGRVSASYASEGAKTKTERAKFKAATAVIISGDLWEGLDDGHQLDSNPFEGL